MRAPSSPVEIIQQNCHYIPHVFTMMTNQTLNVKNGDMTLHNIHAWAEKNPQFNVGQPVKGHGQRDEIRALLKFHCRFAATFTSGWAHLSASSIIRSHTVSKASGSFELKLPPGNYEITAWHEKFGKKTMMVMVSDNDKKEVNFRFNANDKAAD